MTNAATMLPLSAMLAIAVVSGVGCYFQIGTVM
jgi:hypothetical protein